MKTFLVRFRLVPILPISHLELTIYTIGRLLRHLAAMGYIEDCGVNEYKPTNFIKSLSIPIIGDGYLAM